MIPCPLTTFVLSYALARGVFASGLVVTVAMVLGMIVTIGGVALIAAFARDRLVGVLARSAGWRERAGRALEVGGALLVFLLGATTLVESLRI
jgi:ABC-type nickel/cobalt efflux system permease component RcnA